MFALALALSFAGSVEPSSSSDQSCLVMYATNSSDWPVDDYVLQRASQAIRSRRAGNASILIWARWLRGRDEKENIAMATRQAEDIKSRIIALKIPAEHIRIVTQGRSPDGDLGFLAITFGSASRDSALATSPLASC